MASEEGQPLSRQDQLVTNSSPAKTAIKLGPYRIGFVQLGPLEIGLSYRKPEPTQEIKKDKEILNLIYESMFDPFRKEGAVFDRLEINGIENYSKQQFYVRHVLEAIRKKISNPNETRINEELRSRYATYMARKKRVKLDYLPDGDEEAVLVPNSDQRQLLSFHARNAVNFIVANPDMKKVTQQLFESLISFLENKDKDKLRLFQGDLSRQFQLSILNDSFEKYRQDKERCGF